MGREVLVVDDSEIDIKKVQHALSGHDFNVTAVRSGKDAISLIEAGETIFEIIILDWLMPEIDGIEVCKKIRSMDLNIHPFIAILTKSNWHHGEIYALECGADDYITKPFDAHRLVARLRVARRMIRYQKKILTLSETDPLTHLVNRRGAMLLAKKQLQRLKRSENARFCLILCDLDHFKYINDTYGHPIGDNVLVSISNIMRNELREYENISRIGGEEFLILLEADASQTAMILSRLSASISSPRNYGTEADLNVSMSFGCLELGPKDAEADLEKLINKADELLYAAKGAGRNCIVLDKDDNSGAPIIIRDGMPNQSIANTNSASS